MDRSMMSVTPSASRWAAWVWLIGPYPAICGSVSPVVAMMMVTGMGWSGVVPVISSMNASARPALRAPLVAPRWARMC